MTEVATTEPVEKGLWTLVRHEISGSSTSAAARELGIRPQSLKKLKLDNHARYMEIREHEAHKMRARIAAEQEDLMVILTEAELDAARQLNEKVKAGDLPTHELTLLLKHLSQAKANSGGAASRFRGEPTQVVEVRDSQTILRQLARLMPKAFEGQAELIGESESPAG